MFSLNQKVRIFSKIALPAFIAIAVLFALPPMTWAEGEGKPVHPGYPMRFEGSGILEGLAKESVVINDASFSLSPDVVFNRPDYSNSGPSGFRAGDEVGFNLDSKGRIESVWLIKRNAKKK